MVRSARRPGMTTMTISGGAVALPDVEEFVAARSASLLRTA